MLQESSSEARDLAGRIIELAGHPVEVGSDEHATAQAQLAWLACALARAVLLEADGQNPER